LASTISCGEIALPQRHIELGATEPRDEQRFDLIGLGVGEQLKLDVVDLVAALAHDEEAHALGGHAVGFGQVAQRASS
jgi:hypothetical protein